MKTDFNLSSNSMDVRASFSRTIAIPEAATITQLKEFDEACSGIMVNPTDLILASFERIFNEPFEVENEVAPGEGEA